MNASIESGLCIRFDLAKELRRVSLRGRGAEK